MAEPNAAADMNAEQQALAATREMFGSAPPPQPTVDDVLPGVFVPPITPSLLPPSGAQPVPDEVPEPVSELDAVIPDEIAALLAEPDDDEDDDDGAYTPDSPAVQAQGDDFEYEDPEVEALRKRAVAAEKKAAHYEGLRVKAAQKAWQAEAQEIFPLSNPETITATSRRSFLLEAKQRHNTQKPVVERYLEEERKKLRDQARQQWGTPNVGGQAVPAEAVAASQAVQAGFDRGGLQGGIKEWIKSGKLKL